MKLFRDAQLGLQLPLRWVVQHNDAQRSHQEDGRRHVKVDSKVCKVAMAKQGTSHTDANEGTDASGGIDRALSHRPLSSRQDLGHDGVEQRLSPESDAHDTETGDDGAHRHGSRRNDGSNGATEQGHGRWPLAAPEIRDLADDGPKDDGEDDDGLRWPGALVGSTEVCLDRLGKKPRTDDGDHLSKVGKIDGLQSSRQIPSMRSRDTRLLHTAKKM